MNKHDFKKLMQIRSFNSKMVRVGVVRIDFASSISLIVEKSLWANGACVDSDIKVGSWWAGNASFSVPDWKVVGANLTFLVGEPWKSLGALAAVGGSVQDLSTSALEAGE